MLLLFLLCVIGLWMYWAYITVSSKRDESYDNFERVDIVLKKRYELVTDIIQSTQNYMIKEQSLIESIKKLKDEVIELGMNPEFMNRRIALDKELEKESEQLIAAIKENSQISADMSVENSLKAYKDISLEIESAKHEYNESAHIFRKAVDVFPTSFMARLNNIKSVDYMK